MSIETLLYSYGLINRMEALLGISIACALFSSFVCLAVFASEHLRKDLGETIRKLTLFAKISWMTLVASAFITLFLPDKGTVTLLTATKVSKEIMSGSPVPEKVLTVLHYRLDKMVKLGKKKAKIEEDKE